ncbi:MAG: hypothetical protein Crog4KO_35750 [Crocinitomicaceae bacterium]
MSVERSQISSENEPQNRLKVFIQPVTFQDLVNAGVPQEQIDQLSDEDLNHITHNLLVHFNHDVFPHELYWQVGELLDDQNE